MGCDIKPCMNGGTCNLSSNGLITCQCSDQFTGTYCDEPINACSKVNPCRNDGFCIPKGEKEYSCICTRNFLKKYEIEFN